MQDNDDAAQRAAEARKGSPFLASKEAAFYLGLRPHTLILMRRRSTGPKFRRHGRHIKYHIDDLDAWSKGRRQ